jgi:hypothetical protein
VEFDRDKGGIYARPLPFVVAEQVLPAPSPSSVFGRKRDWLHKQPCNKLNFPTLESRTYRTNRNDYQEYSRESPQAQPFRYNSNPHPYNGI